MRSPLKAFLENWLFSILNCRVSFRSLANFPSFCRWCKFAPRVCGNEHVPIGVETDKRWKECRIVVTRSLVPLAGGPSKMSPRASTVKFEVGSCGSRHLIMVNFVCRWGIYWYHSTNTPHFTTLLPFRSSRHRPCCHRDSCHWASDGVVIALCVPRRGSLIVVSVGENEYFLHWFDSTVSYSIANVRIYVSKTEREARQAKQGPSYSSQKVLETLGTSGDETDTSIGRREVLFQETSNFFKKMERVNLACSLSEDQQTPPTNQVTSSAGLAEKVYRSSLTGTMKVFGIFRGFAILTGINFCALKHVGDVCWDSTEINWVRRSLSNKKYKIMKGPVVVRDQEHLFAEDINVDGAGAFHPKMPLIAKVSCLMDVLKMGGSYKLVEKLWARFVWTAGRVSVEVAWTLDKAVVSSVTTPEAFRIIQVYIIILLLVDHFEWNVAPYHVACGWVGWGSSYVPSGARGTWDIYLGILANLGERHIPLRCRPHLRSFFQQCCAWIICSWVSGGCCEWFRVTFCFF